MNRKAITGIAVLSALIFFLASGCANKNSLVFHQNTVLGVNASFSPENGSGHFIVGFDRDTTTFVPRKVDEKKEDGDKAKKGVNGGKNNAGEGAMSILAHTHIEIGFIEAQTVIERFATGKVATDIASSAKALELFTILVDAESEENGKAKKK